MAVFQTSAAIKTALQAIGSFEQNDIDAIVEAQKQVDKANRAFAGATGGQTNQQGGRLGNRLVQALSDYQTLTQWDNNQLYNVIKEAQSSYDGGLRYYDNLCAKWEEMATLIDELHIDEDDTQFTDCNGKPKKVKESLFPIPEKHRRPSTS